MNVHFTAKSYPVAMLSRSCNYFTKDILNYVSLTIEAFTCTCTNIGCVISTKNSQRMIGEYFGEDTNRCPIENAITCAR